MRRFIGSLRIFRRLREAEAWIEALVAAIKSMHGCIDCGGVQVLGHPKTGKVEVSPGQQQIRCPFHQDVYERSPRGKNRIIVPGNAPLSERVVHLRPKGA